MREMHGLRRKCGDLPAWPAHRVRFARAVCLPDSACDRSMTPDGPPEIVDDHDDVTRAGERVREIFDWWSRSGEAAADGCDLFPAEGRWPPRRMPFGPSPCAQRCSDRLGSASASQWEGRTAVRMDRRPLPDQTRGPADRSQRRPRRRQTATGPRRPRRGPLQRTDVPHDDGQTLDRRGKSRHIA